MAGHSQFANIKHRKNAQDAKKAKLFTKILREITVAAKTGQADPEFNPRLRSAIIEAKVNNMPKDRIDAAIKKVVSGGDGDNFEQIRYEGYANGGIAMIVEALTDNRNRTAGEVRSIFSKMGGALGETGSVGFLFDHVGLIQFDGKVASEDGMLEIAIDCGASDVESSSELHVIYCEVADFSNVRDELINKIGDPISAKLDWRAKDPAVINNIDQAEKLIKLVDALEDLDDVQSVTGAYIFSDEVINKL